MSSGQSFCAILPIVHALTGFDSTSALFGKRKKYVLKTVQVISPDAVLDVSELYRNDHEALRAGRKFIAALYDPKQKAGRYHGSLNDLRSRLLLQRRHHKQNCLLLKLAFNFASWQAKHMLITLFQMFHLQLAMVGSNKMRLLYLFLF